MSDLINDDDDFICGRRCTDDEPCVAIREPNCDGVNDDVISFEPIPAGQGWCLNGHCYDLNTLIRINNRRDPISRRNFRIATLPILLEAVHDVNTNMVRLLIEAGADVNAMDYARLLNQADANRDVLRRVINAIRRPRENDDSQSGRRTRRRFR